MTTIAITIPTEMSDACSLSKQKLYVSPIHDEDAAKEWASHAYEIMRASDEEYERHFIVDELIEYAQFAHKEIGDRIVTMEPYRKAYSFFFCEKKPLVELVHKTRSSNKKFEVARKVARWWKIISPQEKEKYILLEKDALQKYNQQRSRYVHQQTQFSGLIEWVESNRSFILTCPSNILREWSNMLITKF